MFNCAICGETVGPRISSVSVALSHRPAEYHNEFYREDEFGNKKLVKVDSEGSEIEREIRICPPCAHEGPAKESTHTVVGGRVFQEKLAPPLQVKLIACAIDSMLDALDHGNKQAKKDAEGTVPLVKEYVDTHKDLVF